RSDGQPTRAEPKFVQPHQGLCFGVGSQEGAMDEDELAELTAKKPLREGWKRSELKARRADDPKSPDVAPKTRGPVESRPSRSAEKRPADKKAGTRVPNLEEL